MARVQLNLKIRPEAAAVLREKAAADGVTLAALVESWLLGDVPPEVAGEVAARLTVLEAKVAALESRSQGGGSGRVSERLSRPVATPPAAAPGGGPDRVTTAQLALRLGVGRNALNNWAARNPIGASRDGWRMVGREASPAGGPARMIWERCAET